MGKIKQLHIDCTPGNCLAKGYESTCYMQDIDEEPREPSEQIDDSDRNPIIDQDRE